MTGKYIPENNTEVKNEKANAVVYFYMTLRDKPAAIAYSGKRKKPDFNYSYSSEEQREEAANKYFDGLIKNIEFKEERKEQRKALKKEMADKVEVGSIFHYSWGYEQTQCEFFQVITKKGQKVTLRAICGETTRTAGHDCEYRKPVENAFVENSEPFKKILTEYGISMNHGSATLVESEEKEFYCSWYY